MELHLNNVKNYSAFSLFNWHILAEMLQVSQIVKVSQRVMIVQNAFSVAKPEF